MIWESGTECLWQLHKVNPKTWTTAEEVNGIRSLSISRSCTDSVPMLTTASAVIDGTLEDGWYKVSCVTTGRRTTRHAIDTFWMESGKRTYDKGGFSDVKGYSALYPADKVLMTVGSYAAKGTNGAEEAAKLLRACIPAPVSVRGAFILSSNVVYSVGMSMLAAAWSILDAGGYCITLDGEGRVQICPKPTVPDLDLSRANARIIGTTISEELPTSSVPNRYNAIDGSMVATAVNNDPLSSVSYARRGMWVDAVDKSPKRINGETLNEYAERKLREASRVTRKLTYTREYVDEVRPFSVVRGSMPEVGLSGDMIVLSQSLTCGSGISVQETAGQEVWL